ncbi:hypothetical protein [Eisenibacter elegans]|uniref:hypothetical protein n=1 Tax=Eisenibacter elegans TaxID=997 RepID=UPI001B7F7A01|nr:hypothetical protein [Eisenibacter elegans]
MSNSLEGFKVRLSLVNTREDVAFEEVKVIVQFFDANNKAVAEHTEIFDQVKPGQKFSREISKNIDAETVNRRIDSFVLKDLDPPTLPDTLQAKKEKLQDAQERLKKLQQEAN